MDQSQLEIVYYTVQVDDVSRQVSVVPFLPRRSDSVVGRDLELKSEEFDKIAQQLRECFGKEEGSTYLFEGPEIYANIASMLSSSMLVRHQSAHESSVADSGRTKLYGSTVYPDMMFSVRKKNMWEKLHTKVLAVAYDRKSLEKRRKKLVDCMVASCVVFIDYTYASSEIHSVCVDARHQGKGVCKEFIEHVIRTHLSMKGVLEVRILCQSKNRAACKCYGSISIPHITPTKNRHITSFVFRESTGRKT